MQSPANSTAPEANAAAVPADHRQTVKDLRPRTIHPANPAQPVRPCPTLEAPEHA
jgi:hypothetical protein